MNWQPMKTMPNNEFVLLGVWVTHLNNPKPEAQFYIAYYDYERDDMVDQNYEHSLPWDEKIDYDFWMPIPELPEVK